MSSRELSVIRRPVAILSVPTDGFTMSETLDIIEQFIASGKFHQIATANTDFLLKAHEDPAVRRILRQCDLVIPDGMPLVMAGKWLNCPIPERVTGADLVPKLATLSATKGYKIFMLGAREEVAIRAREVMEQNNPGLKVVGQYSPPPSDLSSMDHDKIHKMLEETKPDILLVAFGNPKQEKWISMNRHRLRVPVCIGIGGTFDFIAGEINRAPEWIQKIGMEWFYRFSQEPKRMFKRYLNDIVFFGIEIRKQIDFMKNRPVIDECSVVTRNMSGKQVIIANGGFEGKASSILADELNRVINQTDFIVLSLADVDYLDSFALGSILVASGKCLLEHKTLVISGAKRQPSWVLEFIGAYEDAAKARTMTDAITGKIDYPVK